MSPSHNGCYISFINVYARVIATMGQSISYTQGERQQNYTTHTQTLSQWHGVYLYKHEKLLKIYFVLNRRQSEFLKVVGTNE